jgi:hypothetical protein
MQRDLSRNQKGLRRLRVHGLLTRPKNTGLQAPTNLAPLQGAAAWRWIAPGLETPGFYESLSPFGAKNVQSWLAPVLKSHDLFAGLALFSRR